MSLIGVVDCNNFFVSCERLFRPDLQHKPVAVLSSNDGCIVARSQEVKDMRIPMGVPYFKVKDIIKDNGVTLFSSHFALYRDISKRVFLVLRQLLPDVEQYSVDEAFFLVPDSVNPVQLGERIKAKIEAQIGIPVSVGIASSKTQAKYAVEVAKKTTGVTYLSDEDWRDLSAKLPLAKLWGVGGRTNIKLKAAGYSTVAELVSADLARVKTLFGIGGHRLVSELKGKPAYFVDVKQTEQKSIMSSRSFKTKTFDRSVLEDAVAYHTRHIAADLRKKDLVTTAIRVSVQAGRHSNFMFQGASLEAVLDVPTNDTFVLLAHAQKLLKKAYKRDVPYKKVGVSASFLISNEITQPSLLEPASGFKNQTVLLGVIDALNTKADRELITVGDRHRSADWRARKDLISPSYTTKWTDVATVKT